MAAAERDRKTDGRDAPERILRAALQAFSELGFEGATTREIATRAGVPLGLLQYHFGGKPKLWRAAVDRAFAELRGGLDAILRDPRATDARARLRLLIRGQVAFVSRNPEFVRLMHDEGKRRGPRMRWMVDRHVKPLYEALLPLIEGAQASGALPADIPAVHLVYTLIGAIDVIFHQAEECKRVTGVDPADPQAAQAHARAVENLLLGPEPTEQTHE
jgi:AcrR family transcriptional regulator